MREKLTLLKTTRFAAVIAAAMLLAGSYVGSAQAMTLSLVGAGVPGAIPAVGFDLGAETGLAPGNAITIFDSGNVGGISLDSAANVVFTFLGFEAVSSSGFDVDGSAGVFTTGTPVGTTASFGLGAGLLDFAFTTLTDSATNGGPFGAGGNMTISFADLGDGSFIALFGNGAGDEDRDDFAVKIAVSAVPLPAAVWLFLSAILGLVSFTRIRRDQKVA